MTHRTRDACRLVGGLSDRFGNLGVHVSNHPHHRARHVLLRLRVSREIVHRVAGSVEDMTVIARHAKARRERLHDLKDLGTGHVLRQDLKVLRRGLRGPATSPLSLRCLGRGRGQRPCQAEDAKPRYCN